jgi:hypothetical protein
VVVIVGTIINDNNTWSTCKKWLTTAYVCVKTTPLHCKKTMGPTVTKFLQNTPNKAKHTKQKQNNAISNNNKIPTTLVLLFYN